MLNSWTTMSASCVSDSCYQTLKIAYIGIPILLPHPTLLAHSMQITQQITQTHHTVSRWFFRAEVPSVSHFDTRR